MKLLAIDTSSEATVLGLQLDSTIIDVTRTTDRSHSRDILPSIDQLMNDAGVKLSELDAVVFGQGPGSFTGLRIAIGVVQGLTYGLQIPAVPVSSMACLAQAEFRVSLETHAVVALKARLEEVYFGTYTSRDGVAQLLDLERVEDVSTLPRLPQANWLGIGDGWGPSADTGFQDKLIAALGITPTRISLQKVPVVEDLLCIGRYKLERGGSVSALEVRPEYLREQVAVKPSRKN